MPRNAGVHIRRLILPVYLPMLLVSAGKTAPAAAFPQYLAGFGATVGVVGLILSLRGFGNIASDLPGGVMLGRVRLRKVMGISLFLAVLTSLGIAITRNVVVIGILTLLSGTTTSIVVTATMTYIRVTVPGTGRGRALSLVGGSVRIGALVGPIAGGFLADALGTPSTFVMQAACNAAALAAFLSSPDRDVGFTGSAADRVRFADQLRAVASGLKGRGRALATVGFSVLMLMLLRESRNLVLPLWGDRMGLSASLIGTVMSVGAAMELLLFIPAGMIMDRAGRKVAGGLCIGIFSLGLAFLPLTASLAGFVVASLLIGVGNGLGAGINMTMGTDLAPSGAVSEFVGLWRLFGDIGQTAGPAVVGGLAGAIGLNGGVLVLAGLGGLGLLVLGLFAPETLYLSDRHE